MATMKLTAKAVAALTTNKVQAEVWDELVPGLALRVGRGGSKTWIVRYRVNGTHRRLKLGRYPILSLADARDQARGMLATVQRGEDPAVERDSRRSEDHTFGALAEMALERLATRTKERTRNERRRIVDVELLPHWRSRLAGSIARSEVVALLDRIAARGAPIGANRTLEVVRLIFNVGLDKGFPGVEANPAHRLQPPAPASSRDRYLDRTEIKKVWDATAWEAPVPLALYRFALLTAQRIGNVCALRWSDIDAADVWRIEASSFKGNRAHLVPLSAEAMAALDELRQLTGDDEYVFAGRGTGKRPYFNGVNKATERLRDRAGIPRWSAHDFRRTFRTWATRSATADHPNDPVGLGVEGAVADAVLGHREASLGFRTYTGDQERYLLAEKRDALKKWGAFVAAAVKEPGQ